MPPWAVVGVGLVLFLTVLWLGTHTVRTLPNVNEPTGTVRLTGSRAVVQPGPPAAPGADHRAQTAKAVAAAKAAQVAADQAEKEAGAAAALLATIRQRAKAALSLAAPELARNPSAKDPSADLTSLQAVNRRLDAALATLSEAVGQARQASTTAQGILADDPAVQADAAAARQASDQAAAVLASTRVGAGQGTALLSQVETTVAAWRRIHGEPPGVLGVQVRDAPADWTVHGCEVLYADPGSAAGSIGLVGARQRTDPVGDVIASITDLTDRHTDWPIGNCQRFTAAMAHTRAGDRVTVDYYHRRVVWYLLSGRWVPESGTATLGKTPGPTGCPESLTGTITPVRLGNRIALTIRLSGPAGVRPGIPVMLDTGGVQSYFPNSLMRTLGYVPFGSTVTGGIVPGATGSADLYHIAGTSIDVLDHGRYVPLATGSLTVMGLVGGSLYGLAPDILKHGTKLSTSGSRWTLTPPCA